MCLQHAEPVAVDDFSGKMVQAFNSAALTLMVSVGHRTGLFDTMSTMEPATSTAIAHRAGLSERYVREWLGAMVTGEVVDFDPETGTYSLPADRAAWLTRAASPNNLGVTAQWLGLLGSVEDKVVDAFKHGRGVPYGEYKDFHRVMAEESNQTTVLALREHIVPLVPGLAGQLERGINVADIGCGAGSAMIALAGMFPRSQFVGYDFSEEAVAIARKNAAAKGLKNVTFAVADAAKWAEPEKYDLITAFDAIHDQARPDLVLKNIRASLKPGGIFLMQDIAASSQVDQNVEKPLGTFTYTISTFHCMSVSLAGGGMGLGAAWGKELALEMLSAAGFHGTTVHELPHDIINYYYVTQV